MTVAVRIVHTVALAIVEIWLAQCKVAFVRLTRLIDALLDCQDLRALWR